ncbi:uncharacterized protein LOC128344145 isoform X2 [Hemicordylus capensis]|uniref:uncharacterized protein LOC128344145 isoform X2 n=1 Tax=Hemicordylus capensis TaxID=884348 RepID=UPI002304853F|nr:uncharacterized protein LOC128344145 isoform X2 [Hemicordylus capensis]
MADKSPVQNLCDEMKCPICLEYFSVPVNIECGHIFCRACITQFWEKSPTDASCPQCRVTCHQRNFRPIRQLASIVEIAKKFSLQMDKRADTLGKVCERHQEPLKLFCENDQALICVVCDKSREHRQHNVIPKEEASIEDKDEIQNHLEFLNKERETIISSKLSAETQNQILLASRQPLLDSMGDIAETRQKGTRGLSWRHKEVIDLISIWGEKEVLSRLRGSHRNIDTYEYIASKMCEKGHKRTALECRTKVKTLKHIYKTVRVHNSISGHEPTTCPFYEELDVFLHNDASIMARRVVSSIRLEYQQPASSPWQEGEFEHHDLSTMNAADYLSPEQVPDCKREEVAEDHAEETPMEQDASVMTAQTGCKGGEERDEEPAQPSTSHGTHSTHTQPPRPQDTPSRTTRQTTSKRNHGIPTQPHGPGQNARQGSTGGMAETRQKGTRGVSWRHKEVIDLISIWREKDVLSKLRGSHRNIETYEYIASKMCEKGHKRTALECRTKVKTLKHIYKTVRVHNSISGHEPTTCPFYEELDVFLHNDASIMARQGVSTMRLGYQQPATSPRQEWGIEPPDLASMNAADYLGPDASILTPNTGCEADEESNEEPSWQSMPHGTRRALTQTSRLQGTPSRTAHQNTSMGNHVAPTRPRGPGQRARHGSRLAQSPTTRFILMRRKRRRTERLEDLVRTFIGDFRSQAEANSRYQEQSARYQEQSARYQERMLTLAEEESTHLRRAMDRNCRVLEGLMSGLSRLQDRFLAATAGGLHASGHLCPPASPGRSIASCSASGRQEEDCPRLHELVPLPERSPHPAASLALLAADTVRQSPSPGPSPSHLDDSSDSDTEVSQEDAEGVVGEGQELDPCSQQCCPPSQSLLAQRSRRPTRRRIPYSP